jgi:hypothetical protein
MVRIVSRLLVLCVLLAASACGQGDGAPVTARAEAPCSGAECGKGETCGAVDVANFAEGDTDTVRLGPFRVGERVRVMAYSFDRRPSADTATVESPDGRQLDVHGALGTGASQLEYTSLAPGCADFVVSRVSAQVERIVVSARRMM